jgi:hypothetical protein
MGFTLALKDKNDPILCDHMHFLSLTSIHPETLFFLLPLEGGGKGGGDNLSRFQGVPF